MNGTLIRASLDDAAKLRKLAAWYREFAERAGNSFIWESRVMLAEDLEREAARIELEISERRNHC
jgi:hypothetical protein